MTVVYGWDALDSHSVEYSVLFYLSLCVCVCVDVYVDVHAGACRGRRLKSGAFYQLPGYFFDTESPTKPRTPQVASV